MRAWLARAWAFARELSGEAALERRMRACRCAHGDGAGAEAARAVMDAHRAEAVKEAWTEAYGGIHRCC